LQKMTAQLKADIPAGSADTIFNNRHSPFRPKPGHLKYPGCMTRKG